MNNMKNVKKTTSLTWQHGTKRSTCEKVPEGNVSKHQVEEFLIRIVSSITGADTGHRIGGV